MQPRYCMTCGGLLTLPPAQDQPALCEHCLRPFDPADPSTYLPVPPPDPHRWWHTKEVPGLAWLLLYLLGSAIIGTLLPDWVVGIHGRPDRDRVGNAAGAIVAVMLVVFAFIPWLFACTYLLLVALEHHLRDELVIYLTAGAVLGAIGAAGYHPALLLVGGILGTLAGLIRQGLMASHD